MDYEEFDIGNFEDELCVWICNTLKKNPKTANEIADEIGNSGHIVSTKLQKLKTLGIVGNVKTATNICYWGLNQKHRK